MIETNPESPERLKRFLSDSIYHEALKNSAKYNSRICLERKQRLPFLDAHTGVAESDCSLWMPQWQRMPGVNEGQLYTYPSKRWRKKRRQYLLNDNFYSSYAKEAAPSEQDLHAISVMENSALHPVEGDLENGEKALPPEDSKDSWYKEFEESMEIPDIPDPEEPESEGDDYEETYLKKKKKKSKTPRFKKKDLPNDEKPYVCDLCSARYKTRPGLSYHYAHSHNNNNNNNNNNSSNNNNNNNNNNSINNNTNNGTSDNDDFSNTSTSSKSLAASSVAPPSSSLTSSANAQPGAPDDALAGLKKFQDSFLTFLKSPSATGNNGQKTPGGQSSSAPPSAAVSVNSLSPLAPSTPSTPNPTTTNGKATAASANAYCDFCLGDNGENKKTQQPEELVTCSDCGRSAHPTCLQFTPTMTASVKKYKWQCIECKSCGLCGTSDNDDQLLFCDDCDRGYHMYCLTPPLSEPPEGSWSCHLCVAENHGGIPK